MLKQKEMKEEIEALIEIGKQRGFVTYEEMNNFLPTHLISTDQLDDVMIMFSEMDIEVVNAAKKQKEVARRGGMPMEENKPPENPALAAATARSNDPVRMYLRRMGTVPLLSREGEIEIAKRIEEGEQIVRKNVLTSPLALQLLGELVEVDEERCQKAVRGGK